ncbi:MAG: hypothetical protein EOP49_02255 [Sphingobacteriales bacterium]|nr:MAG: hypothetical protein EOP49_02255 [Sphingobacteriales bacterium]
MDPNNHIALLPNPASSKSIDMAHVIASHLTGRQLNFSFHSLVWPEKLEGFSSIWIIGGDGTLHYFLNRFPDCDRPLAIFPGGTGNDFHWHLYGAIPLGVQLARVLEGNLQSTDAGSCNGKVFINGLGIGFDGAICKDLSGRKKSPGKTSYLLSALKQISTMW